MLHIFMVLYAVCRCAISANRLASFPSPFLSRPGNGASFKILFISFIDQNFVTSMFTHKLSNVMKCHIYIILKFSWDNISRKCLPHKICVVLIFMSCDSRHVYV